MEPANDPTLEDLLAAARCGQALRSRRRSVALAGVMRALRSRALIAGRHRIAFGRAHPRFGDGSISAASWLAMRGLRSDSGGVAQFREILSALGAACAEWRDD